MAEPLTIAELRQRLSDPARIAEEPFETATALCRWACRTEADGDANELVLWALEHRNAFGPAQPVVDGLVRQIGLYPYLEAEDLGFTDRIAYEYHRPLNLDAENVVFHRVQAEVYTRLLNRENVVLSAPTSFGKSLIIDALIASGNYDNVAVVVPTIALIDETRRRLSRFTKEFKIITHPSQKRAKRNLFVMTQERILDVPELAPLDLFVIDEFYKLQPRLEDEERSYLLNHAFYQLHKTGAQFYLLGPNIKGLNVSIKGRLKYYFILTDYKTVVSDVRTMRPKKGEEADELVRLCSELKEPTLIYCRSPNRVREVVQALLEGGVGSVEARLDEAVTWIGEQYAPDWLLAKGLHHGIGMHHGRLPRTLSHFVVKAFNDDLVRFLVCTSTLIEGVNTKAKNVIVFDNQIARKKFDYFTYNNILGRSGRMFQHFLGHVYIFHDPPAQDLPLVDFPAFTQPDDVPASLLVQIAEEDLLPKGRERVTRLFEESELAPEIIRKGAGIDPEAQNRLARALRENAQQYGRTLAWSGFPTYAELLSVCEVIWEFLVTERSRAGVRSGSQLAYRINQFRRAGGVSEYIKAELGRNQDRAADEVVEECINFLRLWANFWFPRYLLALDRIQRAVFTKLGRRAGDYALFASRVENWFVDPTIFALDEYGIPIQVSQKLLGWLRPEGDLDAVLARLRTLPVEKTPLGPFERSLVDEAKEYI